MPSDGIKIIEGANRLTVTAVGMVTTEGVIEIVNAHYPSLAGRSVLWDLQQADTSSLSLINLTDIAFTARQIPRGGSRKTAYVVADTSNYFKLCQYLNAAVVARIPIEYCVFRSLEAAEAWLAEN